MKKLLLCAAVFLSVISGNAPSEKRGSLLVLGDSIASGYGLLEYVSGNDYSALDSFGSLLGAGFGEYENHAVDGMRSDELLAAFDEADGAIPEAAAKSDTVVVSIGGNDFLKPMLNAIKIRALTDGDFFTAILEGNINAESISEYSNGILQSALDAARGVDVDGTVSNIRKITERIAELNPDADIILLTVYDPFAGNVLLTAASEAADEKLGELNDGIRSLESERVLIADIHEAFKGSEGAYTNISRLDIHPSSAGHFRIYEVISKILGKH
ncbi:MAG: SGNH/GDSL hydrolase family protein [Oscillospiraceae bacterium]|nr:SGNH/GDSL hydrolase family protein [Oscillospiraceae bacterium]